MPPAAIRNFSTLLLDFYSPYAIINNAMRNPPKINEKNLRSENQQFHLSESCTYTG